MKIELTQEDVIKAIKEDHLNDANFIVELVNETTTNWKIVIDITEKLIDMLKRNGELPNLLGRFS